ncbi:MAG: 4-vinyl reductase [Methanomassiliicoccales archaeon]
MKFVKISQSEIGNIRSLYEGVMASASHGLFYREGMLTGSEIIKLAKNEENDDILETARKLLLARGWADSIEFDNHKIIVKGSIEVGSSSEPTCHRLRGVFKRLFEALEQKKMFCEELECESAGAGQCVFELKSLEEDLDE